MAHCGYYQNTTSGNNNCSGQVIFSYYNVAKDGLVNVRQDSRCFYSFLANLSYFNFLCTNIILHTVQKTSKETKCCSTAGFKLKFEYCHCIIKCIGDCTCQLLIVQITKSYIPLQIVYSSLYVIKIDRQGDHRDRQTGRLGLRRLKICRENVHLLDVFLIFIQLPMGCLRSWVGIPIRVGQRSFGV